ncbi:unnamed protein product [Mytilus coruscus]|uniref:Uncharacterized protein n=1 Tax=Mytilus coruscus TaxID=42192 RepID=A0A6J8D4Y5_MYTCO|nr:unnamed protein product [Mytilus coruscus]
MPFGISPAPEYFQQFLEREIENLPGVRTVADDILIYGEGDTVEEATADHDIKLKAFLDRCRSRNIKLNRDKFQLRLTEMPYIGHLLTADGVKSGPEKIAAITQMDKPKDVKGVQRLLGMVNYLTKFMENLSDLCEPIRNLTHKENAWNWTDDHDNAFARIKDAITKTPVLRYFDPKLSTTLQCDASETGLGATLMQNNQPKSHTQVER